MKNLIITISILLTLSIIISCSSTTKTNPDSNSNSNKEMKTDKFYSEKYGFKINFGGKPKISENKNGIAFMYSPSRNATNIVSVNDRKAIKDPRKFLEKFKQSKTIGKQSRVITKAEDKEINGNPALYIEADVNTDGEKSYLANYIVITDKYFFNIIMSRLDRKQTKEEIESFIGSFELTE